ncbi:MAG TPA: aspartate kinase [Candidatus Limnocylindrales bacterium]|nr:aspartate kinase [Candidatus Limnocylindrales bacterium]
MSKGRLIVMKFGGTSVGNAARFRQCAEIVSKAARQDRVAVVVSAMAGVTDLIFKTINHARQGDAGATEASLRKFELVHQEMALELFAPQHREPALEFIGQVGEQLRKSSHALLTLRTDISAQTMDSLVALGERISAWSLARYLEQNGCPAACVRAEEVIVTDATFGNAAPDMEATGERCRSALLPLLESGAVPVVGGYSGATRDGRTTTLGRGGSDYSATIIGAAAKADEVWIWTDVDGVLTADPRICPDATTLPEISFDEAIELAYYGAKVIHPRAAYPAAEAGFPVWIKNSFRPEVSGTKITRTVTAVNSPVKSVTCVKNATLITLFTRRDVHPVELWGRLFLRLGQEQIEVLFATQSSPEHALGLVLRQEDEARVLKLIHTIFRIELGQGVLQPVEVNNQIAVIAVLGEAMKGTCGILGRVFSAVARREVSVIAVAQGASELSICFAVPGQSAAEVVRSVHDEFCGTADVNIPVCLRPNASTISGAQ